MKYLLFLRLLFIRPVSAWHVFRCSSYNPANWFSKGHIRRVGEYEQLAFPLPLILQEVCAASQEQIDDVVKQFTEVPFSGDSDARSIPVRFDASEEFTAACYCMVRLTRPAAVVETGVGRGATSYYILSALDDNGKGHLYSIELPMLKRGYRHEVGKLVPASLRSRWTLTFGPGAHQMKWISPELGNIDIFVHDSNHSYRNQLTEYRIALARMNKGGIVISDDVGNDALLEASEQYSCQLMVTKQSGLQYIGILVK